MNKEFIPYEEALSLKELGYDYKHEIGYYFDNMFSIAPASWMGGDIIVIKAPLYQQAFRWFREKHMLKGDTQHANSNGSYRWIIWKWNHDNDIGKWERISFPQSYNTFEESELACLRKLIEILKA